MHHQFIDQHSGLDSFLHKMDPRIKIIMFAGIIFFVLLTSSRQPIPLFFYSLIILILIRLSCVPVRFIFLRSLAILPFVILVAFSLLLSATHERLTFFGSLLTKAYLSILSMILLISTTKFVDLLKALEKMHCPVLFVMMLSFMYRYLYLFIDEFMRLNQAQESRTVRKTLNPGLKVKILSNMIGTLLIRSYERGESVYLAMCSRGYRGEIRTLHPLILRKSDCVFLAVVFITLIGILLLFIDHV